MKTVAVIAIAPVVGIAALFMCDAVGMVPADSNTRSNYAATLSRRISSKALGDTIVSATGRENRLLMLDARCLDNTTSTALVNERMAREVARYGFDGMIFQNKTLRLSYDMHNRAFDPERVP